MPAESFVAVTDILYDNNLWHHAHYELEYCSALQLW